VIDGEERTPSGRPTTPILSPASGEPIAYAIEADERDVDDAVEAARKAFVSPEWGGLSDRARAKLVLHLADEVERHLDELFELETLNNGRPVRETRAQLRKLPDLFRYNAGLAMAKRDSVLPVEGDYLAYTRRRPIGVVAAVTPFNHPLLIATRTLAPTLASGCTTVVKPSEYTPLSTIRLWEILTEAGLPPGVMNVVTGTGATAGKALSAHPGIAKLVLTGGTESGRLAGAAAGANFVSQVLELGGKAPVLVFDDFDVDRAVDLAVFGTFIGAGQTCICASRHLVQRTVYEEFVEKVTAKARSIVVGDPFVAGTQMGPVISERQRQRVLDFVRIGVEEGARLTTGGRVPPQLESSGGFYVEPTIFADVAPEMHIAREEVFGPMTVVLPFDDEDQAVDIANDSPYGLAAAVRTNHLARAHRLADRLEAGLVWINDHHRADATWPWGGIKDSGVGREFGQEAFESFFWNKSVMIRTNEQYDDWYDASAPDLRLN